MKKTVVWFVWSISFVWSVWSVACVWLNETNQMNQTDQIDQINQPCVAILLAGCGNTMWALQHVTGLHIMDNNKHRQDAQKGLQQGRSKRRGEEVQTALRVGRSPLQWILANGKAPPVLPTSEHLNP
jgi:hypothetical protein